MDTRLSENTITQPPAEVSHPSGDRGTLTPGIVHLGQLFGLRTVSDAMAATDTRQLKDRRRRQFRERILRNQH